MRDDLHLHRPNYFHPCLQLIPTFPFPPLTPILIHTHPCAFLICLGSHIGLIAHPKQPPELAPVVQGGYLLFIDI